jgi:hypothetical protein
MASDDPLPLLDTEAALTHMSTWRSIGCGGIGAFHADETVRFVPSIDRGREPLVAHVRT